MYQGMKLLGGAVILTTVLVGLSGCGTVGSGAMQDKITRHSDGGCVVTSRSGMMIMNTTKESVSSTDPSKTIPAGRTTIFYSNGDVVRVDPPNKVSIVRGNNSPEFLADVTPLTLKVARETFDMCLKTPISPSK